jgi:hypothetical protein
MKCRKCSNDCEPVVRGGKYVFDFCRSCKIPYKEDGSALFNSSASLVSHFNPLYLARAVGASSGVKSSVAQHALEVLLIQGFYDVYVAGLKDGLLLAHSQDVGPSEPIPS